MTCSLDLQDETAGTLEVLGGIRFMRWDAENSSTIFGMNIRTFFQV